MADFTVKVTAQTQEAESKLERVDKSADKAARPRNIKFDVGGFEKISKDFEKIQKEVGHAANAIQTFYRFSKSIPGFGERIQDVENLGKKTAQLAQTAPAAAVALKENAKAGAILSNSFQAAEGAAGSFVNKLASMGLALFAVQQSVGLLKAAFGGMFDSTIGREIKLRETILKTQSTLASNNRVVVNGKEVTDNLEKIKALQEPIKKVIDDIRVKSLELSGTTSEQVIEVFGVIASQISQVGGGIKEAEKLAISFSAALATFGIPFFQARQEIGSILRGDITKDSYLAKALGITNEEVAKAKTQTGGVVKFLEDRLATAVAGQAIAAQGFSGITSNIKEIIQLVQQGFGAGLLDPLLEGLTKIYAFLFNISSKLKDIATQAGQGIGKVISFSAGQIGERSQASKSFEGGADSGLGSMVGGLSSSFKSLQASIDTILGPITKIFDTLAYSIGQIVKGLTELAKGFLSLQVANIQAIVYAFATLVPALGAAAAGMSGLLTVYGQFLSLPIVQEISKFNVQFELVGKLGVTTALSLGALGLAIYNNWKPVVAFIQMTFVKTSELIALVISAIGRLMTAIGQVISGITAVYSRVTTMTPALRAQMLALEGEAQAFRNMGNAAQEASVKAGGFGDTMKNRAAGGIKDFIASSVKLGLVMFVIQAAITIVIDKFGEYQKAQDEIASNKRVQQALILLETKYKDVSDNSDSATKSARDFNRAIVNSDYDKSISKLEELRKKIEEIRNELKPGIQSFDEFLDAISGSELGQFEKGRNERLKQLSQEEARIKGLKNEIDKQRDRESASNDIKLFNKQKVDITKEIQALERAHSSQMFQLRQQAAQKEIDIFRQQGEMQISAIERRNKKLREGEEGASAAAIEALDSYITTKKRGELDIEANKRSLAIEAANLEKSVAEYRLGMEQKIAEIRKKSQDNDKDSAAARLKSLVAGGVAGDSTVIAEATKATKDLTGKNNNCAIAVKRFMDALGVNSSVMDASAKSAERMGKVMTDWSQLKPGDIVAKGAKGDPAHVGVYTGGQNVFHQSSNRGLAAGNFPDLGYFKSNGYFIRPTAGAAASMPPSSVSTASKTPTLRDASAYAGDMQGNIDKIKQLNAALNRLKASATAAETQAAFDAITKGLYPTVRTEGSQDDLVTRLAKLSKISLDTSADTTLANARAKIEQVKAETNAAIEIGDRERKQWLANLQGRLGSKGSDKIDRSTFDKLVKQANDNYPKYIQNLRDEEKLKIAIAATDNYEATLASSKDIIVQYNQRTKAIREEAQARALTNKLILEGRSDEYIANELRKLDIDRAYALAVAALDAQYQALSASLTALNPKSKEYLDIQRQLAGLPAQRAQLNADKDKAKAAGDAAVPLQKESPMQALIDALKEGENAFKKFNNKALLSVGVADTIASAFGEAFKGISSGTMNTGQAMQTLFQRTAEYFQQMAVQIIANMVKMFIMKQLLNLFGGGAGAAKGLNFADMDKYSGGFAQGGIATGPTSGYSATLHGTEAVVPLSNNRSIPVEISGAGTGGANVSSVVNITIASDGAPKTDRTNASQMGQAIEAAVMGVIQREKRTGGILSK